VLIAPDGTPHYPWVLDPANPDLAASNGINNRDNVEQVFVSNPVTGTWTARVSGSAVPVGPQSFALIGTGINAGNARILTIFNDGNGPLSVTSIVPEQSAPWISVNPTTLSVPAGGSLSALVEVDFALAPPGTSTTRLLVYSDDSDENPYPGGVDVTVITSCQDADNDTVCDDIDNCTLVSNLAQRDTDGDGYGNFCDADLNGDLQTDLSDFSLFRIAFSTTEDPDADFDGSGSVDLTDFSLFRVMFGSPPGPSGLNP